MSNKKSLQQAFTSLLFSMGLFNLLDAIGTSYCLTVHPQIKERNPIIEYGIKSIGLAPVMVIKVILVTSLLLVLGRNISVLPKKHLKVFIVIISLVLAIYISTVANQFYVMQLGNLWPEG